MHIFCSLSNTIRFFDWLFSIFVMSGLSGCPASPVGARLTSSRRLPVFACRGLYDMVLPQIYTGCSEPNPNIAQKNYQLSSLLQPSHHQSLKLGPIDGRVRSLGNYVSVFLQQFNYLYLYPIVFIATWCTVSCLEAFSSASAISINDSFSFM